jgi:hypothetical protein
MYVDKTYENPTACCRFPCLCCPGLMSLECLWPSLDLFYFSHRIKERSFQRFSSFVLVEFYASPPSVFRLSFQNIFASFGGSWNKAKVEILLHNSLSLCFPTQRALFCFLFWWVIWSCFLNHFSLDLFI